LKKDINKKEQQKKEMADVVEQDKLIEIKGLALSFRFPVETDTRRIQADVRTSSPMSSLALRLMASVYPETSRSIKTVSAIRR
jgi:hypothetical protein